MELEAKEQRLVILGLKKLLQETIEEMKSHSDEDDEYVFLSNDAMLIESMIKGFEDEYRKKFDVQKS